MPNADVTNFRNSLAAANSFSPTLEKMPIITPSPPPVTSLAAPIVSTAKPALKQVNAQAAKVDQVQQAMAAQAAARNGLAQSTLPTQQQISPATNAQGQTMAQMVGQGNYAADRQAILAKMQGGVPAASQTGAVRSPADLALAKGGAGGVGELGGPNPPTAGTAPTQPGGTAPAGTETAQQQAAADFDRDSNRILTEKQTALQDFLTKSDQIRNGTYPLSPSEQAQIDGITQQFQSLIQEQMQENQNYVNSVKMVGIMSGRSMYTPDAQLGNIKSAMNEGAKLIGNLNLQMSQAVTAAKKAIADEDYKVLNDQYDKIQQVETDRQKAVEDTYTKAKDAIDAAQKDHDTQMADAKFQFEVEQEKNKQLTEASKPMKDLAHDLILQFPDAGILFTDTAQQMTDKVHASPTYKAKLAKDIASASTSGGQLTPNQIFDNAMKLVSTYPQKYGGDLAQAISDATSLANGGKVEGIGNTLPQPLIQQATAEAEKFGNDVVVKNFTQISDAKKFVDSMDSKSGNPADDQGLIYAFAKAMDPSSAVKGEEYNTIQNYAQSWAETYGFKANRVFSNGPFLTEKAREQIKKTILSKYEASKSGYDNLYGEYSRKVENITGQPGTGSDFLADYSPYKALYTQADTVGYPKADIDAAIKAGKTEAQIKAYLDSKKAPEGSASTNAQKIEKVSIGGKSVQVADTMATKLEQADADFFKATGKHLAIAEGYRTNERQTQLYNDLSKKGARVAKPGTSFHEKGLAVDVTNWKEAEPYLRKYGLKNDLADDKNHFSYGEFA